MLKINALAYGIFRIYFGLICSIWSK